jgi:2-C-methyl-D-erythritol 2,4-cyclodiphosphate synthase
MKRGVRIGHGYDLHRLEPLAMARASAVGGRPVRPLMIGGVTVEGPGVGGVAVGVVAHSDGDVLLHAATDALLGAIGEPDIGQLFPDTAAENAGRDSAVFIAEAVRRVKAAGWEVGNLDATVVLERPKLSPVKGKIRANLARLLGVGEERVNIKGKTHEGVDALGEGRAVEAHVVVVLV